MTQYLLKNKFYPNLLHYNYNSNTNTNTNNSNSNNNSKQYNQSLIIYFPDLIELLKNNHNDSFLNECIQHSNYSNLIKENIKKPCTGLYCKYKKNITL